MRKILAILSTISLSIIILNNIIACNTSNINKISNQKIINKSQQISANSNWKLVNYNNLEKEFKEKNDKWYILIKNIKQAGSIIFKEKYNQKDKIKISNFDNYKIIEFGERIIQQFFNKQIQLLIYRWDGIDKPTTPTIDNNNGKIINWNEKVES